MTQLRKNNNITLSDSRTGYTFQINYLIHNQAFYTRHTARNCNDMSIWAHL